MTIKDLLLINSKSSLNFWIKAQYIANQLQYYLSIKNQKKNLIPDKSQIGKKQNINYFKIFGSFVSIIISKEK